MPRIAGQIDVVKNEAILDAAIDVLMERGAAASVDEIARRANVSKQTIYNHYGSKAELVRALAQRRVHEIAATLDSPGAAEHPLEALTAFARVALLGLSNPRGAAMFRMAILEAVSMPEIGAAIYEAGMMGSRQKVAEFLRLETVAGRLATPDPLQAAELFTAMVYGSRQMAGLLGLSPCLDEVAIEGIAREVAYRFLRAYAV